MLKRVRFSYLHLRAEMRSNPAWWVAPLLITGLLIFSIALPMLPTQEFAIYLPALIAVAFAGMAVVRWPELGLVGIIVAGLIVPLELSTGTNTSINATVIVIALLCGLWVLRVIVNRQETKPLLHRTFRPLFAFLIVAILAFFAGQLPWFAFAEQSAPLTAQLGGLGIYILSFAAFILVASQIRDIRWLQWMVWIFLALSAVFVAGWLVPVIGRYPGQLFQRPATANSMFWTWLVALAFGQALYNNRLQRKWRFALFALVGLTFYVAYFINRDWTAGWFPSMAVIATLLTLRSWRIGIVVAVVGLLFTAQLLNQTITAEEYSYSTRLDAWLIMLEMIKVSPILGFGPANYRWYTPLFPIRGYYVPFSSHNQFLDIIAQVGLLGLACFLWFFAEIGALGWRLRNQVPDGFARAYVYSALGGLVGTMVAAMLVDWVLPFVYNIGLRGLRGSIIAWVFLGGLVAVEQIAKQQRLGSDQSAGTTEPSAAPLRA